MAPPPKAPSSRSPRAGGPRRPKQEGRGADGARADRSEGKTEGRGKARADAKPEGRGKPRTISRSDREASPRSASKAEGQGKARFARRADERQTEGKGNPRGDSRQDTRSDGRTRSRSAPKVEGQRTERKSDYRPAARSDGSAKPRFAPKAEDQGKTRFTRRADDRQTEGRGDARAATRTAPAKNEGRGNARGPARSDEQPRPRFTPNPEGPGRPRFAGRTEERGPARDTRRTDDPSRSRPVRRPSGAPKAPTARAADRPEGDRIAKLLARAGIASRREIERMIEEGRIALNGTIIDTPATILTSLHGVTVDGELVKEAAPARLFLFHKPAGCLTAERDPAGRPTIYDRLPADADLPRLMPVGRLDYSTEGLLLLTNDGELKRLLELPSTGVPRTYRARAFGEISQAQLEELVMGIEIDGMRYGRIDANLERRTGRNTWVEMTLTEGKNREVRRVLEHFGLEVSRLIRTAYGPFVLGDSAPGAIEEVRRHDLIVFRKSLEKGGSKKTEKKDEE
ncbi:MAG TPA: pseudouridine synthase [Sphingobium sp.]|uniref:pseudouridine synthase n=1 Tax=Sphingobium sp. TaxID=1912891 RepID=UPI002ED49F2B